MPSVRNKKRGGCGRGAIRAMPQRKKRGSSTSIPVQVNKRQKTSVVTRHVILGLDSGSSGSRMTMLWKSEGANGEEHTTFIDVSDPECPPEDSNNARSRDFPSAINCATGQVRREAVKSGSWISVKFLMHKLVELRYADDLAIAECIVKKLQSTFKEEDVRAGGGWESVRIKLRALIVAYFKKIHTAVVEMCRHNNFTYDALAVTIPSTWDKPFQQTMAGILKEAFPEIATEKIVFVYESEAIGHYMLQDHDTPDATTLQKLDDGEEDLYDIIIIDFGGHTVNGASFHLHWNDKDGERKVKPAFFSIESSWGHPGGAEVYAQVVEDYIRADCAIASDPNKNERILQLMDSFKQKQRTLEGAPFTLTSELGNWRLSNAATAKSLHDLAFREPLKLVRKNIRATSSGRFPAKVILTGGSYWNEAALNDTMAEIKRHERKGWKCYALHKERAITTMGMLVAQGAALALANSISVSDFLNAGAAFALASGDIRDFDHFPHILLHRGKTTLVAIEADKDFELRIICDPAHNPRNVYDFNIMEGRINRDNAYDFLYCGPRRKGRHVYTMKHATQEGKDFVVLVESTYEGGKVKYSKHVIPVYFDVGQRIVMVDRDVFDEAELKEE